MLLPVELLHSSTRESYVPLLVLYTNNVLKHIKRKKVVATNSAKTGSIYDRENELRALENIYLEYSLMNITCSRNTVFVESTSSASQ